MQGISPRASGPGAVRPVTRGLGAERVQVLTNGIGVIDASAASPDHAVTGDPLGAERIEILRGPATLAYGGGAAGGVVNVIDGLIAERVPDAPLSAMGYAGYTSADEGKTLAARATGSSGPLVGTLSATWRESDNLDIPGFAESARLRAQEAAEGEVHDEISGTLENSGIESQAISGGLSFVGDDGFVGVAVRQLESKYGLVGGHEEEAAAPVELGTLAIGVAAVGETPDQPFIHLEQTRVARRGGRNFSQGQRKPSTGVVWHGGYLTVDFDGTGRTRHLYTNRRHQRAIERQHSR